MEFILSDIREVNRLPPARSVHFLELIPIPHEINILDMHTDRRMNFLPLTHPQAGLA